MEERKERKKVGPFLGIITIVLITAAGGIYFAIKQAERIHQQNLEAKQWENS